MKILLLTYFIIISGCCCDKLLLQVTSEIEKVLDFVEINYIEFNLDGLLGITFAEAQFLKIFEFPLENELKKVVSNFITKCDKIYEQIYPMLPNFPKYMRIFRLKLLNAQDWKNTLKSSIYFGGIEKLGTYKNWTTETILSNKQAVYKGVKTDKCLREILQVSPSVGPCYVSETCQDMMLDYNRTDSGYLLTHRLLYLQIIRLQGCEIVLKDNLVNRICSLMFKEARTNQNLGYPYHDIFLEQVVLCGMEGFAEFLNKEWLTEILSWQNQHGCYKSIGRTISKRTSNVIGFGCSDHSTGLGVAALALNLRYILQQHYNNLM